MDDILVLRLTACCMTALFLCVCMLLVYVGHTSIPLPPTLSFRSFPSFWFLHLQCMCGGNDHLAWKHPVSSKPCRGLRPTGGSFDQDFLSYMWVHLRDFRASLVILRVLRDQYEFELYMDLPSWVRVEGILVRSPFTTAMASIQEALTNLR
ncbi:hypothetical protein AAG906_029311 [Vitis piasezkii]